MNGIEKVRRTRIGVAHLNKTAQKSKKLSLNRVQHKSSLEIYKLSRWMENWAQISGDRKLAWNYKKKKKEKETRGEKRIGLLK